MKPHRLISTKPNKNVLVVTTLESGEMVSHEYAQCGRSVYLLQDVPGMTPYTPIAPDGEPVKLGDRETLEDAVRRMFDEQDDAIGPAWAHRLSKRLGWALMGSLALGTAFAWASGALALANFSAIR